jgi:hypothetical protein
LGGHLALLTVAADVGHWPAIEAPQAVVDAVNVLHP